MTLRPHMPDEEDHMLAAEYVLGVLPDAELAAFRRRLASEPALATSVRFWNEHFAQFANEVAPVTPPAGVKARLEQTLFAGAAPARNITLWNNLAFWRGAAVAAILGLAALGSWTVLQQPARQQVMVAEVAGEPTALKVLAVYDSATGELRLNRTQGSAASGRSLELWLIAGQDQPVSLGVLPDVTPSQHTIPQALRAKFAKAVLAVTDEPAGGSPSGKPTGAVVAKGALTSI